MICVICGSSRGLARNIGAKPAATSQSLRSRKGTSRVSLSCMIMVRLGLALPDSRKLTWRCETPDCSASSSCERRRLERQVLSRCGKASLRLIVESDTDTGLAFPRQGDICAPGDGVSMTSKVIAGPRGCALSQGCLDPKEVSHVQ